MREINEERAIADVVTRLTARYPALDPGEIGDWRRGRLVFHDVRLAEAVADLERYGGGRIGILSREAGQRRVTAVLDARDPARGLDMLAGGLGLRVVRPFAWLTLLLPA